MPVDVIRDRNAVASPGLPEDFIITKPALIKAHIKAGNFMRSVVDTAVNGLILAVHKPVMTRSVHLNKLTLTRPLVARFMLLLFFSRPGARRLDPSIRKHLPDHMVRKLKTVINREVFTEGRKRRIRPELPIEPDNFCTKRVRVFLSLISKTGMAIDESSVALFQIFVFEDEHGLRGKI